MDLGEFQTGAYSELKSKADRHLITFDLLKERLLALVVARLNNGDFTERGLARIIGVSQPQIHNVLKGKRRLQPSLADRMMERFGIDVLDLLTDQELRDRLVAGSVEMLVLNRTDTPSRKRPASEVGLLKPDAEDLAI